MLASTNKFIISQHYMQMIWHTKLWKNWICNTCTCNSYISMDDIIKWSYFFIASAATSNDNACGYRGNSGELHSLQAKIGVNLP